MDIYTNSSIKCKLIDKQSNAVWLLSFTMIFTIILFSSLMLAFSLQGVSLFEEYSKISNKNNFRIT